MIQKFLDAVRNDPKAKELIKAMPVPKDDKEASEGYVKIAKELGFDLTADEILAGLKSMEQAQKAQSEKVSLDDADLENVAGGVLGCSTTHDPGEWCWFSDSCSYVITYYNDEKVDLGLDDDFDTKKDDEIDFENGNGYIVDMGMPE